MAEPLDDKTLLSIDLEKTTGFLLMQVARIWERRIEEAVSSQDLTKTQFFVLSMTHFLGDRDGDVTQSSLAQYGGMDLMMISQVCRRLEDKAYLARNPHPEDSRAKILTLTDTGREKMLEARRRVKMAWADYVGEWEGLDERLREDLAPLYGHYHSS
jgi:DNA-binding MarR family transcriptional regulator